MKNLNLYYILKFIFPIWVLQVFVPYFTSISSVSHPGYLPFLCSNGKYCLAEMDGKKIGDCQWDELTTLGRYIFLGKSDGIYFLVGPKKYHKLGSKYPRFEFERNGAILDSLTGLHAFYNEKTNYLSEFIFTSIPWHYNETPFLYGHSKDSLLLYNMDNEDKYYASGDEIRLHPPYAFIKREGHWIAHDLKLDMIFPEGRQSYLVHNDDLVMYDELDDRNYINPLFFNIEKGMYASADSSFSLLILYHYREFNSSRSESLIAYLVSQDSTGTQQLFYPDRSMVFEEETEWFYKFGNIYWMTDTSTGLLSYDRLHDIVIPERIDSVSFTIVRDKYFIKYLNVTRDSFRVYKPDLSVSADMKGPYFTFFWNYFFLTTDGADSTAICRMYDWKGNLIKIDKVSEIESFRTADAGKAIIKYYGDTLPYAMALPDFCRNMNYSFDYDINIYGDSKLYGWNELRRFSYDLNRNHLITEFIPVNQPDPNVYRDYLKSPQPPPYTYRDFSVIKEKGRYLINCTKPGIQCKYEADEFQVDELDSVSLLILSDLKTSKTLVVNSNGDEVYNDLYKRDKWFDVVYENDLLLVEDGTSDTSVISIFNVVGDTLLFNGVIDTTEKDDDFIFYRDVENQYTSMFILSSNVKIIDHKKCPMVVDSMKNNFAHLFEDFGILYTDLAKDRHNPILKYPWISRSEDHRENSNFYSDTPLGRIYINVYADNPYFADPDIIRQISFEGRVIDCSGK